ncbi:MAG: glycosyltransferase family 2 protein [Chloroflexi bacterium]|nr:glycosyltransferase family 2 protein [Chloroflexota bacterium]
MRPEHTVDRGDPHSDASRPVSDQLDRGCNCGRRFAARAATPLLTDDLVIAARDRAREPELPEATVARALSTPTSPRLARYDVIIVSDGLGDGERDARIAAEFARHEHRVFHLGDLSGGGTRPAAPTLHRIAIPAAVSRNSLRLLETLAALRQTETIEAAALFAPSSLDIADGREMRRRWSWRIISGSDERAAMHKEADVRITFDTANGGRQSKSSVHFQESTSWPERWAALDQVIRQSWARASVVVLTHDNLAFSRMCLTSVLENTEYPNYELIVVDNASSDGTVEDLKLLASTVPHVEVILNDDNAGFGPGNNQGLASATGDVLVLLNNDTIVPRGWLTRLTRHLEDARIGLIGPATNRSCNEAQIDIPYQTYGEFQEVARSQGQRHDGERFPIRMPMMFCVAFRRDTYERLGPLDERYEIGMFEDEDYALRAKGEGLEVAWTPEVYVHHAYHASIGKLLPTGDYMRLVKLNQGRFEEKWGICWERHRPLPARSSTA